MSDNDSNHSIPAESPPKKRRCLSDTVEKNFNHLLQKYGAAKEKVGGLNQKIKDLESKISGLEITNADLRIQNDQNELKIADLQKYQVENESYKKCFEDLLRQTTFLDTATFRSSSQTPTDPNTDSQTRNEKGITVVNDEEPMVPKLQINQ